LLSTEERKRVLELVIAVVNGRVDVIANIGVFATEHGIELARHAEETGAAAISSVPPFYFNFTASEHIQYYHDVANAVDIPMIIYNIPGMSGVDFSTEDIAKLFENKNIVGMKHTSYDLFLMQKVIERYPEKSVFIGHDELFLSAYCAGAQAAIGSTFNFMAEKFIKLQELIFQGFLTEALVLQGEVNDIIEVLCKIGVFKGIKAALKMQGIDCGATRKPFLPLTLQEEKLLEAILVKTNCL